MISISRMWFDYLQPNVCAVRASPPYSIHFVAFIDHLVSLEARYLGFVTYTTVVFSRPRLSVCCFGYDRWPMMNFPTLPVCDDCGVELPMAHWARPHAHRARHILRRHGKPPNFLAVVDLVGLGLIFDTVTGPVCKLAGDLTRVEI